MWLFDQPPNAVTEVSISILENGQPILLVTHEDDHGWQFLDGCNPPEAFELVRMSYAISLDDSLCELADLPAGWCAWRDSVEHPWRRELLQARRNQLGRDELTE